MIGISNELNNGLFILVDYLSFTVKENISVSELLYMFGLNPVDFQFGLKGANGYKSRIRHNAYSISVLFDGNEDMGINFNITGSAIPYFMESYKRKNFPCVPTPFGTTGYSVNDFDMTIFSSMLERIISMGHITRLDIAIDDKGCQYYSIQELVDIFDSGCYTSKFRRHKEIKEKDNSEIIGHSIYLGSRSSEILFRIYDKQKEQNTKKYSDKIGFPWVRWEIETHKDRACMLALAIIGGKTLSEVAIGVLSNYLRIINMDNERKSRCSSAEKWTCFINGLSKVRICHSATEKTLKDKKEWLMKQVAPTIAAIHKIDGDLSYIYSLIECGNSRQSAELRNIIHSEILKQGYDIE